MNKNVGSADKIFRIVVGVTLIAYATVFPETGYNAWGWVGILPLATALINFCPAYAIFGFKTSKTSENTES